MLILLAIAIAAAALAIVAYPIIARARTAAPTTSLAQEELDELIAQRDAVFQALRDLHFDRQVGKVTAEDFTVFEANLKDAAADALRAVDHWEAQADAALDATLERAIAARRAALTTAGRTCPACGRSALADDKFCAGCGAMLPVGEPPPATAQDACPQCGRPYEPDDRFCGGCGRARA